MTRCRAATGQGREQCRPGTRDPLLGTFDIQANRTAQRTNDIVKILTVVSVLLLPTTVIAGFMGMNIKPPYSNDNPAIFWIVLAAIVSIAVGTLIVLRLRRWLWRTTTDARAFRPVWTASRQRGTTWSA